MKYYISKAESVSTSEPPNPGKNSRRFDSFDHELLERIKSGEMVEVDRATYEIARLIHFYGASTVKEALALVESLK